MSALAVVQARMSSTRLPGKVLADVAGEPMLVLLLRRLGHARAVGEIRVATSTEADDDAVAAAAAATGVGVHRGSLEDVLGRFAGAAAGHPGPIARITADCPLVDPAVVDAVVDLFERTPGCGYASNVEPRTYPDGLDVEVFSASALADADAETTDPREREHVTGLLRRHPDRWPPAALVGDQDLGELRWTVDTAEDLAFVSAVAARLGARRDRAGLEEILDLVRGDPVLASMPGGPRA